jgi:ribulose-phosphate 3-epimerase
MSTPPKVAPSILAADFLILGELLRAVEAGGADRIHVDVMDGRFVPNLSLGIPIVEAVRRGTRLPVEVHLMIEEPDRYLDAFAGAGGDQLIIHQDTCRHLHRAVHHVKGTLQKRVSVALNPATPETTLSEILPDVDGVLVMTVNPGFGGQRFIESTMPKLSRLRATIRERRLNVELEVDGGVDERTAAIAAGAGADVLVAGTSVFDHPQGATAGVHAIASACAGGLLLQRV